MPITLWEVLQLIMEKLSSKNFYKMKNAVFILSFMVMSLLGGCQDSKSAQEIKVISPQEVRDAVYDDSAHQLVDVRTPEEFKEGHLKNAQNICVTDADFEANIVKLDRNKPVYLYCRSGKRSSKAAAILKDLGFTEIYDMEGGILKWEGENLETQR